MKAALVSHDADVEADEFQFVSESVANMNAHVAVNNEGVAMELWFSPHNTLAPSQEMGHMSWTWPELIDWLLNREDATDG